VLKLSAARRFFRRQLGKVKAVSDETIVRLREGLNYSLLRVGKMHYKRNAHTWGAKHSSSGVAGSGPKRAGISRVIRTLIVGHSVSTARRRGRGTGPVTLRWLAQKHDALMVKTARNSENIHVSNGGGFSAYVNWKSVGGEAGRRRWRGDINTSFSNPMIRRAEL